MVEPIRRVSQALAKRTPLNPVRSKLTEAVASLTFDDVPKSATEAGARVLEANGLNGTFYVCGGHTGAAFEGMRQHDLADLKRLRDAGHEIGCHTFSHQDATRAGAPARRRDHEANRAFMSDALEGDRLSSFAYPYGATSLAAKLFYARRFFTCRGVFRGLNKGWVDFSELKAHPIESWDFDAGQMMDLVAEARDRAGWLIFYTHDVSDEPTRFGCTPRNLETVVEILADAGVETLPVKAAASRVMFAA